ncbi:SDR family oxidoreductase [Subtercola frigoramans]|uniref:NAD(P)-dependent dehydrogenase (Short-subunit alcohol dehydrogenase family) n=1 Tax=Subtercola frigoramans TaxID=120298 RepID=A0ABS2L178_9MICO|nr:SDR family oxidoreductase [Subtercola frigoramans]MBM7470830.1 NAD(P)-dependent dehydrogenase (short-subunit alcohol dehydrogenase family) [Subtercola frigoramans]
MADRLLVTGGASGIGRAIALHGQSMGWEVVVIDRSASDVGRSIVADLSDPGSTATALEDALSGGPITRLVNNVGAVFPAPLEEQSLADLDASFSLNLRCAVQCAQAVLPGMTEAGFGRIVNMSSRAALGKELRTAYAAAKAGLIGLTRVWALELGQRGITVNAIGPGPIATDLFMKANPADSPRTKKIIESVPVGRLGEPEDIAHAAGFFLDDRAGFVTGQVLYVCGGLTVGVNPI